MALMYFSAPYLYILKSILVNISNLYEKLDKFRGHLVRNVFLANIAGLSQDLKTTFILIFLLWYVFVNGNSKLIKTSFYCVQLFGI